MANTYYKCRDNYRDVFYLCEILSTASNIRDKDDKYVQISYMVTESFFGCSYEKKVTRFTPIYNIYEED